MDWSRFDRDRFRKIMAMAMRADGAEALSALHRARAHLEDAGGSFDELMAGEVTVFAQGAPGVPAHRANATQPARPGDVLQQAVDSSRIVAQLRIENRRLNDLLDEASRYIAELESEVTQARETRHGDAR